MTTLFPQIKRVSEDETSKIIKNVLFINQDDTKLEQIFAEFEHLTNREAITSSDVDDVDDEIDDDDADDSGDDRANGIQIEPLQDKVINGRDHGISRVKAGLNQGQNGDMNDAEEDEDDDGSEEEDEQDSTDDEDDEDEEEDDDDDDEGQDDDDDDSESSDGSDSSDSEEEEVAAKNANKSPPPQASREPTSWNLDQFFKSIPVKPVTTTNSKQQSQPKQSSIVVTSNASSHSTSNASSHSTSNSGSHSTPNAGNLSTPKDCSLGTPKDVSLSTPKEGGLNINQHQNNIKEEPKLSNNTQRTNTSSPAPTTTSITTTTHHNNNGTSNKNKNTNSNNNINNNTVNNNHHNHKQPSSSCIVQIDLSKLKRIPSTKAPTPTTLTGSNSILTAKALKHEADAEKDKTKQAIKYLESAMYFVLHGYELETANNHTNHTNNTYYYETTRLFKHVIRLSAPDNMKNPDNMTNLNFRPFTDPLFFNNPIF